tara:strand:- start:166 stop:1221 length:1056 start_codon:yes stop_codon:yes gene_type:complete
MSTTTTKNVIDYVDDFITQTEEKKLDMYLVIELLIKVMEKKSSGDSTEKHMVLEKESSQLAVSPVSLSPVAAADVAYQSLLVSLQTDATETIERLVQQALARVAEPVMDLIHRHDDISVSSSSLFPVFDPETQFMRSGCYQEKLKQFVTNIIPNESVILITESNDHVHIFTSLGRYGCFQRRSESTIKLEGEVVPLTNEYIEIWQDFRKFSYTEAKLSFIQFIQIYKKYYPLASVMQKNQALLEELKLQEEVNKASLEISQSIDEKRVVLDKELLQLETDKEQFRKRLRSIAVRENDFDMRYEISQIGAELLKASSLLVDACDTVDNKLIENMVQQATKSLVDTLHSNHSL